MFKRHKRKRILIPKEFYDEERHYDQSDSKAITRSSKDDLLRLARDYVVPYWKKILLILLIALVTSASPYVFGYMSKIVLDNILQVGIKAKIEHPTSTLVETQQPPSQETSSPSPLLKSKDEKLHLLLYIFIAYIAIRLLFIVLNGLYSYYITDIGQRIVFTLRSHLHMKLQSLQMTYFDQQQTGKLMSRIFDDVSIVQYSVSGVLVQLITNVAMLIIGTALLIHLNWRLSLFAFAMFPFYAISYKIYIKRIRPVNRANREKNSEIYAIISQVISSIRVVMSFAQELFEARKFFRKNSEYIRLQLLSSLMGSVLGSITSMISVLGTTMVFYYGALAIKNGTMTFGEFTYFTTAVSSLFGPVINLTNMNAVIQWVLIAIKRVFEVLDEEVTIKDTPDAIELKTMKGNVTFQNVSLCYPTSESNALTDISCEIPSGAIVALVGPSGAGKSSLVSLLLRLYDPTEGEILIDGIDIRKIKLSSLRKLIRMVPQEPILFSGTIADNIRYGAMEATNQQVVDAAKAAELHDFLMTLPEKYEAMIGERGMSLSGGQKQRLAFAMVLITNPTILILDDSTSALDAKTEAKIQKTLSNIMKGRTTFIITHRISTAQKADIILVLEKGYLIEKGTHKELMELQGLYYRIAEQQAGRAKETLLRR
jgi:subfamily B ATP-binding cassette protein MsbA